MKRRIHLMMALMMVFQCHALADTNVTKRSHPGLVEPSNVAEQWLDSLMIPEVQFRAANMYDCFSFIQTHINEFATRNSRKAPRILYDYEAIRHISSDHALYPTFSAKEITAFRLIKILEAIGDLQVVIGSDVIVVEMKTAKSANKAAQATAPNVAGPGR